MSETIQEEKKKCTKCKHTLVLSEFKQNRSGIYTKSCKRCLDIAKKNRDKYKCEHGKRKARCAICGGSEICIHGRLRNQCRDCDGASFCEHDRQRSRCKDCGGASICEHDRERYKCKECSDNPLEIIARNIVNNTKRSDKRMDKYDEANHIDLKFVREILTEQQHCHYCDVKLQYVNYESDLATIERLDNKLGHIKSNCVIACRTCNFGNIGSRLAKLI